MEYISKLLVAWLYKLNFYSLYVKYIIAQHAATCKISRIYLISVAEHAGLGMAM